MRRSARRRAAPRRRTCPLCHEAALAPAILAETAHFTVLCHPVPLAPGHLLVVPRVHRSCLALLPGSLHEELRGLQRRLGAFLVEHFGPAVFVERRRRDPRRAHAHLHALPWPAAHAALAPTLAMATPVGSLAALRRWYLRHGAYLFVELDGHRYVAPAHATDSWRLLTRLGPPAGSALELAAATRARWQAFQQRHGPPTVRVVNCVLVNDGAVCLLKRSAAVGSGRGKWHIVSGYLPEGKDPLVHAYDEVAEETGLRPDQLVLRRHCGPQVFADRAGGRPWEVDTYLFTTATRELRLNWEHDAYVWVPPERLGEFDCLPWLPALYRAVADGA
jgi:diadenosine tetraphosphate (Ap4A) HIT family hydrolase/8-oxo-dGTP pyrophosphatase MutT (NUDIX family)